MALDPQSINARYQLGVALACLGRWREALEEARKALQIDPNNQRLKEIETVFQQGIAGKVKVSFEDDEG